MLDTIIRGGTLIDGTGSPAQTGDIGIANGRIVEMGERTTASAREVIDADGALVTPGFIDIHTHYDGQFFWDDKLDSSFSNGVTTVTAGNCGVGFAPQRPEYRRALIEMMEGVEDIPGAAAAGEHVDLISDPGSGRIDQVNHRDARAVGALDDPDDLLHGARAPGGRLDRGIVRHLRDRPAADLCRPGDHAVGGQAVGEHVGEGAVLGEAALIDEQRDPLPGEQLALGRRGLVIPGRTARIDPGPELPEVGMARPVSGLGSCCVRFYVHGRERT